MSVGRSSASLGPVELELFTHRLTAVAWEMGELLQRTAVSVNVKERLDFSCAVLDRDARLVVNAPHVPVHLGALGLCVRKVREAVALAPGDAVVTNHPRYGGSHLPDVTLISPVHAPAGSGGEGELIGYVANRAHHAEIGGRRPGSMPTDATTLEEEGVVLPPLRVQRGGAADWSAVRERLAGARWPTRALEENLADLGAALAANRRGAQALSALAGGHGVATLAAAMRAISDRAGRLMTAAVGALPDGRRRAVERLDDGTPIAAAVEVAGERLRIDFSGTGEVHPGNLNAPPAVARSAVLYVLRLLLDRPVPLNEGLLEPVELVLPRGLLNPRFEDDPARAPAVVGGNVETSQRTVDTLLSALGLAACSQGTMNNVLFGNRGFGYYETICGGAGAVEGQAGADAVHTHMTNTRITDPEILEHRYPVRLERFAVRRGSGGSGRWPGGDGVVRELRFLEPVEVSVVSQHRVESPYGVAGGGPGARGRQRLVRRSGEVIELGPVDGCRAEAGDRLVVETPGGGGWGAESVEGPIEEPIE